LNSTSAWATPTSALALSTLAAARSYAALAVSISCCEVTRLVVDPKAIDPAEKAMLEDLVAAAVNAAVEKARAAADEHMSKATGGIKIPGVG